LGVGKMAAPHITPEYPKVLTDAVANHHLTREVADKMSDWSWRVSVAIKSQEETRIYGSAIEGDIAGAISEFGRMLRALRKTATEQSVCLVDDEITTRWRRYYGAKLITDHILREFQFRVMAYLPLLLESQGDTDAVAQDKTLLRDVITNYGLHRLGS